VLSFPNSAAKGFPTLNQAAEFLRQNGITIPFHKATIMGIKRVSEISTPTSPCPDPVPSAPPIERPTPELPQSRDTRREKQIPRLAEAKLPFIDFVGSTTFLMLSNSRIRDAAYTFRIRSRIISPCFLPRLRLWST